MKRSWDHSALAMINQLAVSMITQQRCEGQPHCAAKSTKIKSSCSVSHLSANVEGGAPDIHCSMAFVSNGGQGCKG